MLLFSKSKFLNAFVCYIINVLHFYRSIRSQDIADICIAVLVLVSELFHSLFKHFPNKAVRFKVTIHCKEMWVMSGFMPFVNIHIVYV